MKEWKPLAFFTVVLCAVATQQVNASSPGQQAPDPAQLPQAPLGAIDPNGAMKLPNTVSAPPFSLADKFDYRVIQTFGLRGLAGAAIGASIGQGAGSPYSWGGGVEGYTKRYVSGFAGNLSRQSFGFVLESALHEDPRYFPSEGQPGRVRLINAIKQVFVCKTDTGRSSFAYGRVISAFAAGQLVNAWQPASTGSVGDGFRRGVFSLGGDFAYNLLQEFFTAARPHSIRHRH